jgi:3-oxoacyl-[acyl-carrier-protein] synthase II
MELALEDAGLKPSDIGYVNGHGTATEQGDIAETLATSSLFGEHMPISSQKASSATPSAPAARWNPGSASK